MTQEAMLLNLWGELRAATPLRQAVVVACYATGEPEDAVMGWTVGAVEASGASL